MPVLYQVAHHRLLFDIMKHLVESFGHRDIELLLLVLRCKVHPYLCLRRGVCVFVCVCVCARVCVSVCVI